MSDIPAYARHGMGFLDALLSGKYDHKHECQHGHPHDGRCECVCGYQAWSASKSPNGQAEEWAPRVSHMKEQR